MVSQKFMDILYQQPHYSKPSTSSSSSTITSDVQKPLQMIKEENEDRIIIKEEEEDMIVVKEEEEDMIVKEEEDDNDDWQLPVPQTKKSDMNMQVLPLDKAPNDDKKSFSSMCLSLPHLMKNKQVLRPPSKRIRREKIIFDPSVPSNHIQKNHRKEVSCKTEYNISCISETNKSCNETPNEDTVTKCKGQWAGDLTCEYCGKYMQRSDYLRLHLMKHTGETPHKCPYCKNGYRTRWRLAQHLRTHTKNLPYHCPFCNYRGNRSDYLTSHLKRIHKELLINDYEKMTKKEITNDKERK